MLATRQDSGILLKTRHGERRRMSLPYNGMTRRQALAAVALPLGAAASPKWQVGAYYFPNYHVDPRNEAAHGPGWTEWDLVRTAQPRFPGHHQPKRPLWGFEDESDPRIMARKIDAAAGHGLTHFIFDWYWFNDGPYLGRALDRGFLEAANNSRLKFCLMWANHDWVDIHPAKRKTKPNLQFPGTVSRETFERLTDHVVERYFRHPSHWKIDGKPYFSIYELYRLVQGLGGIEKTADALRSFRRKTEAAGLPGLHLNAVVWGVKVLPGEKQFDKPGAILDALGFDSVTSYVWVHHVQLPQFPVTPYAEAAAKAAESWRTLTREHRLPYHPNVTVGWDASPRTVQSDRYTNEGYPFMPMMGGNTPEAFRASLTAARRFVEERPDGPRILNINAWNEWTEGSYLEPDQENRMAYLEAIRDVFAR
jgi:hypothetical protein